MQFSTKCTAFPIFVHSHFRAVHTYTIEPDTYYVWSAKLNENRGLCPTLRHFKIPVFTPKKQFLSNSPRRTTRKKPFYNCHALKQDDSTNYSSKLKIWKTCCRYGGFLFIPPVWTMCACAHELSNSLILWGHGVRGGSSMMGVTCLEDIQIHGWKLQLSVEMFVRFDKLSGSTEIVWWGVAHAKIVYPAEPVLQLPL